MSDQRSGSMKHQHTRTIWDRTPIVTIQDLSHPDSEDMDDVPLKRSCTKEVTPTFLSLCINQDKETRLMQRVRTNKPSPTQELHRQVIAQIVPSGVIRRASAQAPVQTEPVVPTWSSPKRQAQRPRGLLLYLTGAVLALFLILLGINVINWVNDVKAHWKYGDSYVSTQDIDVGHSGTSHFLAFVNDDTIVIVEFSSAYKGAQTYTMKVSSTGSDHYAITLEPEEIDGRLDLLVLVNGNEVSTLYNMGNSMSFTPPQ